uniref:Queuosine 5'-phosphate N-glycosylase/hydrolase n=1 Tax=Dracunculus medinensis TaxID=318479 RepID=A0A0N4UH34_DRAME
LQIFEAYKAGKVTNLVLDLHPQNTDFFAVDWIFFVDTINFSFWSEEGEKFEVTYKNQTYTGYFAACACVKRALDHGIPLLKADFMENITEDDIANIFRGDKGISIPLAKERLKVISEAGRVLNKKFHGSFSTCLEQCNRNALNLIKLIIDNFESYRDFAEYKTQKISFLKRAQILVSDLYGCFKGTGDLADFTNISMLTMFADYRVPQALAYLGVLKYSSDVFKKLQEHTLLENGSELEVQLRAFSIKACEMSKKYSNNNDALLEINTTNVDTFLWFFRRNYAKKIEEKVAFHRVRCIYY